ncbi:MAG TPA: GspH/FimT family pseudopilin [Sphingomonas sp.]|jgi:general secretion pathway protein H|nr:GspH/FimT family pseudopilin [Sphingomonas sp.]
MPISAAGNKPYSATGFTLVELMVVVTVIALASAIAVMAMPGRTRVADEAARFAVRARAARDLAIVGAAPTSVWVSGGGYGFDRRVAGGWVPISDKPLRVERWDDSVRAETGDAAGRLRITFDTTGMADRAAEVRLTRGDDAATVAVGGDGSVRVDG